MKKTILFLFLFSSMAAVAQKNELNISYQIKSFNAFSDHVSLSYFRNVGTTRALGLRANFQWSKNDNGYDYQNTNAGGLDLLNRWYFSKKNKVRFWTELGVSAMRVFRFEHITDFCYCLPPVDNFPFHEQKTRTTHLGFVGGLGIDFRIFKGLHTGLAFNLKTYFNNEPELADTNKRLGHLNFLLGYKF